VREVRNPKPEGQKKAEVRNPIHTLIFFCLNLFASLITGSRRVGFRISDFFRPSDFGLRIYMLALVWCAVPFPSQADTNEPSELPASSLLPPRGEIPPGFWEQYGTWVILVSVLLLGIVSLAVWALTRPKLTVPVPYGVQARQELDPLLQQPENGTLLSRASHILRHYVALMFALPSGELTTSEFCQAVLGNPKLGSELASQTMEFLKMCDLHKFAPSPPGPPPQAVRRALGIIDLAEKRLAEINRVSATNSNPAPPIISGQAQGQPNGT
jgi:hypothetical protein